MATRYNGELSHEYEDELLGGRDGELGGAHEAQHEDEFGLHELGLQEAEHEDELGLHELGLGELGTNEASFEDEFGLGELGDQEADPFLGKAFKRIARGVGGFVRRAAPMLKGIARIAVPMVAGAVGGPLGGMLGKVATQALGEEEAAYEDELGLGEASYEDELGLDESAHELGYHEALPELGVQALHEARPEGQHEVMAEVMAEVAALAQHEIEAEAMAGAAAVAALSAADRAALRRLLPHLIRGVAVLTKVLRRQRVTRPAVRAVPTIFRTTVRTLRRRAAAGRPVNRRVAGQVMAAATRRVLTNPQVCGAVIVRNLKANRTAGRGGRPVAG